MLPQSGHASFNEENPMKSKNTDAPVKRESLDTDFVYNPDEEPSDDEAYEDMYLRGVKPEELDAKYQAEYEAWIKKNAKP